jgi:aspartate/glutamate racemase
MTRIVLIHAVAVAMPPIEAAFQSLWPDAERTNLLEDALSPDRARDGRLTLAMTERFLTLGRYAATIGAEGILFTCSAFGEAIEAVAREQPVPVLKPNEAMFEAALAGGDHLGMLATFEPSVASMTRELEDLARERGKDVTLEVACVEDAMAALRAGDGEAHDRLLAEAAPRLARCDAVMLAHFSTARAEAAVTSRLSCPVLTAPGSAVRKLKRALRAA